MWFATVILIIVFEYGKSLKCYSVHWFNANEFIQSIYECHPNEASMCASLFHPKSADENLKSIPADQKCYTIRELRERIDCDKKTFDNGCFLDPENNKYLAGTSNMTMCICNGDFCNYQENIENIFNQQNIYILHDRRDCSAVNNSTAVSTRPNIFDLKDCEALLALKNNTMKPVIAEVEVSLEPSSTILPKTDQLSDTKLESTKTPLVSTAFTTMKEFGAKSLNDKPPTILSSDPDHISSNTTNDFKTENSTDGSIFFTSITQSKFNENHRSDLDLEQIYAREAARTGSFHQSSAPVSINHAESEQSTVAGRVAQITNLRGNEITTLIPQHAFQAKTSSLPNSEKRIEVISTATSSAEGQPLQKSVEIDDPQDIVNATSFNHTAIIHNQKLDSKVSLGNIAEAVPSPIPSEKHSLSERLVESVKIIDTIQANRSENVVKTGKSIDLEKSEQKAQNVSNKDTSVASDTEVVSPDDQLEARLEIDVKKLDASEDHTKPHLSESNKTDMQEKKYASISNATTFAASKNGSALFYPHLESPREIPEVKKYLPRVSESNLTKDGMAFAEKIDAEKTFKNVTVSLLQQTSTTKSAIVHKKIEGVETNLGTFEPRQSANPTTTVKMIEDNLKETSEELNYFTLPKLKSRKASRKKWLE